MLFKKKKKYEDVSMIVSINPTVPPVGYEAISSNLKISGKYYKFVPDCFADVFKGDSNIALYIRTKYTGVYLTDFYTVMRNYYAKLLKSVPPGEVYYTVDCYRLDFIELFDQTKEYSIEMDIKNGMPDVKHILHFHDNENEIEGFFVYYDSDFVDKKYQKWFEKYIEFRFAARCKGYRGTLCH